MAEIENHWTVYIIRADDDRLYTGITTDLQRRWQQHSGQRGGAKFFRGRKPLALVYAEPGHNRSSASRREAAIKRLTRAAKQELLQAASNTLSSEAVPEAGLENEQAKKTRQPGEEARAVGIPT